MIWDAAIEALPRDDCYRFKAANTYDQRLVSAEASGFISYLYPHKDTLTAIHPHRYLITVCSDARKRMMHSFGAPLTLSIPTKLDADGCPISFQQFSMPIDFSRATVRVDNFTCHLYFFIHRQIFMVPYESRISWDTEIGADPPRPATLPRCFAVKLEKFRAPGVRLMRFAATPATSEPKHLDLRDGKWVSDVWEGCNMPGFAALFTTTLQSSGGLVDIVSLHSECFIVKLSARDTGHFFRPWILPSRQSLGVHKGKYAY